VRDLLALAKEEIDHFEQVHNIIVKRGLKLGRERKDEYVNELYFVSESFVLESSIRLNKVAPVGFSAKVTTALSANASN